MIWLLLACGSRCDQPGTVCTWVGTGLTGAAADGGCRDEVALDLPTEVVAPPDGTLVWVDYNAQAVRRVRPGEPCDLVETVLADVSWLRHPGGLVVADGVAYVSDVDLPRVIAVDLAGGTPWVVAGTGTPGDRGDGGPADRAELTRPEGLVVDADGSLYVADPVAGRIRRVDADGTIWPFAGNGTAGPFVDGGPADAVPLLSTVPPAYGTFRLALADGSLHYVDADAGALRRVDLATGTVHAVAEGFVYPWDVVAEGPGEVLVVDTIANCVRAASGAVVAGTCGQPGDAGDGGPAVEAELYQPFGATRDAAGALWLADSYNHRIRRVAGPEGR